MVNYTKNNPQTLNPDYLSPQQVAALCGKAKKSGNGWMCSSPLRKDKNPSLNIFLSPDGNKTLLHDFAEPDSEKRICQALGIDKKNLCNYSGIKIINM